MTIAPFNKLLSDFSLSFAEQAIADVPRDAFLFPEEAITLCRSVEKRRLEFTAGRFLARNALSALQMEPCAIAVGPHRQPLWPEQIIGSITHCNSWCAAAVGRAEAFLHIGIDIEDYQTRTLSADLVNSVCVDEELQWLGSLPVAEVNRAAMAIFSAKESLFKALFPQAQSFLGFQGAQIIFNEPIGPRCSWHGRLRKNWAPYAENDTFDGGRCVFDGPYVATAYIK